MLTEKGQKWVYGKEITPEPAGEGVVRKVLAYCDEIMCVQNEFEEGAVGPLHSHPHTQITYVIEGEFSFTIGDTTKTVTAGDTLLKQDGIIHGCVCTKKGILLDIFNPLREDFIDNK